MKKNEVRTLTTLENTPAEIFQALQTSPTLDGRLILLKELRINGIVIPKDYKTNGANIPRVFWMFVPPFKVQNLVAVVVHDYLCDKEDYLEADRQFKLLLDHVNLEKYKNIMVKLVRRYHNFRYGED
jgi:hypothetical protein